MRLEFKPDTQAGSILAQWWQTLADQRGDRAELRRVRRPIDALIHPATISLIEDLRPAMAEQRGWEERIGAIAGLSSHLDFNTPTEVMRWRSLGDRMADRKGEGPVVSELRFRRLLQRNRNELYHPMIRILHLLDGQASLFDLATAWFYWGDSVRKRWALDYFPRLPETT